ncbi:hypothetical protein CIB48_g11108 [Xylaria polymorpha]|nr:hypothetical protein CIB48_g11108 [Xylaria polymorpha]
MGPRSPSQAICTVLIPNRHLERCDRLKPMYVGAFYLAAAGTDRIAIPAQSSAGLSGRVGCADHVQIEYLSPNPKWLVGGTFMVYGLPIYYLISERLSHSIPRQKKIRPTARRISQTSKSLGQILDIVDHTLYPLMHNIADLDIDSVRYVGAASPSTPLGRLVAAWRSDLSLRTSVESS